MTMLRRRETSTGIAMNKVLVILKYIAFLNIPLMLGGLYFIYAPMLAGSMSDAIDNAPKALILIGLAFSLTSFRDVKKIDKMGRFIIERPIALKVIMYVIMTHSLIALGFGAYLLTFTPDDNQLGVGLISFGIGFMALVKSMIDQAKDLTDHYN